MEPSRFSLPEGEAQMFHRSFIPASRAAADAGTCVNAGCRNAQRAVRLDTYPGAGRYCPLCGDELARLGPATPPISRPAEEAGARPRSFPARLGTRSLIPLIVGAIGVAIVAVAVTVGLSAFAGRTTPSAGAIVCDSSMTQRLAGDLVRAYAAAKHLPRSTFAVAHGGACDVFVVADASTVHDGLIARDAIVAVVHPRNPLRRITPSQLRAVFTGRIVNWSQLGGRKARILAMAPKEGTDEERWLRELVLGGAPVAGAVRRAPSSGAIVRAVASANGRDTIGFVAFSAATPAKVVALGNAPPPSPLSIADHRYPLSVNVTVREDERARDGKAADLVHFTRSAAARSVVVRDGLVTRERL